MQLERSQLGWRFWRRWVWVSTGGWFGGFLAGFVLAHIFEPIVGAGALSGLLAYFMLGASLGTIVGLMQWLVLRKRISGTGWWVMASAAGLAIAGGAGYGAAVLIWGYSEELEGLESLAALSAWTLVVAFGGALTGLLQWRVLRRHVRRAGWWVLASTAGWGLSMAAAGAFMVVGIPEMSSFGPLWFLGSLVWGGMVLGAATGAALVWLLE